ncbi:mannose-6-phosphate isomerase, class I [Catenovulum sediminis]|uniref:mannose-6-phosphate isomerase, class I n=1 Tax=Catenovulum sediminis TaxID=1740262 RepID=UPI00117C8EBE|nr:mannose-6-phosphate isomerase, class I [Catenovulum sediminis]
MFSKPLRLNNQFQNYDWGTYNDIPAILGIDKPDTDLPLAELWVGAHPNAPSMVADSGQSLNELIRQQPELILGAHAASMDNTLPYLFKILSARKALSIQVHPSKAQAQSGFKKERAAGITAQSQNCNYKDDNHKPELIYALTPFYAMAGFRTNEALAESLLTLQHPDFDKWAFRIKAGSAQDIEAFYHWLLYLDGELLTDYVGYAVQIAQQSDDNALSWLYQLYQLYGVDSGIFFPLILNLFELSPGQAIFLGAGCPHAYLKGTGIEIMANSDNVLRGGLTQKYMDRAELVKVTQYTSQANQIEVQQGRVKKNVRIFDIPCPDFQFELLMLNEENEYLTGSSEGVELYFVVEGQVAVSGEIFVQGESFLWPASLKPKTLTGANTKVARVYTCL